jgi:Rrf2 family nitric oxide-sensitive transcriptional repressor
LRAGCNLRGLLRSAQEAFYRTLDELSVGDPTSTPTREALLSLQQIPDRAS